MPPTAVEFPPGTGLDSALALRGPRSSACDEEESEVCCRTIPGRCFRPHSPAWRGYPSEGHPCLRSGRDMESFPLVARTAMQAPSSNESETIAKNSLYIPMWVQGSRLSSYSVIGARSYCVQPFSPAVCAPGCVLAKPGGCLFSDGLLNVADPFLDFAGFLLCFPRSFEIGVLRRLSNSLFDLASYFEKLAFSPVFGTWSQHWFSFLRIGATQLLLFLQPP